MQRIKMKVVIKLLTPLHVGGDVGPEANISYILRDIHGGAYYPGTAFKGKVRHFARSLQTDSCVFPQSCNCTVCRLFGGEGNARGSLFFGDFYSAGKQLKDVRTGNVIDRFRRVTEDKKLFTTESAAMRELVGYITGNIKEGDSRILEHSIKLVQQIGGNSSRGFGWLDGEIEIYHEAPEQEEGRQSLTKEGVIASDAKSVRLTLTPRTPLLIGTHTTQSNFRDTQQVIPGAVLRAALARAICEQDGTDDPSKEGIETKLPADKETLFPHLRHSFGELRLSALHFAEPFPLTVRRCKLHSTHGTIDVLAAMLCGEIPNCPVCGERLEQEEPASLQTVISTHSEIDRHRGTARDGRLYTIRAIAPDGISFSGTISEIPDWMELRRLLKPSLRVGGMLTTGFGECVAAWEPVTDTAEEQALQDMIRRIEAFNKLVNDKQVKKQDKSRGILVPITLMSDTFIEQQKLKEPEDGDYHNAYASLTAPFAVERAIVKGRIWRGFDTGQKEGGFEKEAQYVLKAGSVLVIRMETLDQTAIQRLEEMACQGIGINTVDGYGAVRIVHDNHLQIYNNIREDNGNDGSKSSN